MGTEPLGVDAPRHDPEETAQDRVAGIEHLVGVRLVLRRQLLQRLPQALDGLPVPLRIDW